MSPDDDGSHVRLPMWALLTGIFVAALLVGGIVAAVASSGNDNSSVSATGDTTTSSVVVTTVAPSNGGGGGSSSGGGGSGSSTTSTSTTTTTKPPAPSSPGGGPPPSFFLRPQATITLTPMTTTCSGTQQVNVNVTWSTKRATVVQVTGTALSSSFMSGSQTVSVGNCFPSYLSPEMHTYTLAAANSYGTVKRQVTLTINST